MLLEHKIEDFNSIQKPFFPVDMSRKENSQSG